MRLIRIVTHGSSLCNSFSFDIARSIIVDELNGRVTILDKAGKVGAHVGTNTAEGIGGNRMPPEQWRTRFVVAPHGVATNTEGDLFVAEFSTFGRVHKFARR